MVKPRENDPLWMAIFRSASPWAMDQADAAKLTQAVWDEIRQRAGLRMVPDVRFSKWRHAEANSVPRAGDIAWSSGWHLQANPFPSDNPANWRWTADWWRAAADNFNDHVYAHEGDDNGQRD